MRRNAFMLIELLVVVALCCVVSAIVGAYAWPYSINTWLEYAGKPGTVTGSQGAILGFVPVIGYLGLPIAAITWIAMLFLA